MSNTVILPNLYVAGAPKSGTSFLCNLLSTHPDIYLSETKEPCFFSTHPVHGNFDKGWKFYEKHFRGYDGERYIIDGSTRYFYDPHSAYLLNYYTPKAKIIFILRNPIDSVYSNYWPYIKSGRKLPTFDDMVDSGHPLLFHMVHISKYQYHLSRFSDKFEDRQILILDFRKISKDLSHLISRLSEFIGVPGSKMKPETISDKNSSKLPRYKIISRMLTYKPLINNLKSIVPYSIYKSMQTIVHKIRNLNNKNLNYDEMPIRVRKKLEEEFNETFDFVYTEYGIKF